MWYVGGIIVEVQEDGVMLDFDPVWNRTKKLSEIAAPLTASDLRDLTNEIIDKQLALITDCEDADVVFQPVDPKANDPVASSDAEQNIAWTLGHVIVHITASSEESAFLAAELARGVENHGRSRYEVPWETVTTIAQCRERLEESRRMRLASLDMWPDKPHLDNLQPLEFLDDKLDARARFLLGLAHDTTHLEQIADIVRQAREAQ